jgi:2-polyprenyl-3-methyl-5-hydroxy-6-metoxy-1,4-benzoquinol methylase
MQLTDVTREFAIAPQPWDEGRTIPWEEPGFSHRMLAQHLNQAHDAASRRTETIEKHLAFIKRVALSKPGGRVLDLGCGPGLYTQRLAEQGFDCFGIDLGPASIEYAVGQAIVVAARCRYALGDLRAVDFGTGYDLVMFLFGDFNPFPREDALDILRRCKAALTPEGRVLLEVHSFDAIRDRGKAAPRWMAVETGLFSEAPHVRLDQSFWLEDSAHAVGRHWVVDAATGETTKYGWTLRAYTNVEYEALLNEAGLKLLGRYENLIGTDETSEFPVLLAARA